jgi:hypothetical protein
MAALVAATHEHPSSKKIMGGPDKPGHDDKSGIPTRQARIFAG